MTQQLSIQEMKMEIESQIKDAETLNTLMITTFKGLTPQLAKRAMLEAMMTGFNFVDFLQKNIYAIPFGQGQNQTYSLVSSIDHARKVGMRSGVVGKSEPIFEEVDGKPISCTITIKRKVGDYVGDYSAKVYLSEYSTGRNLWASKPRTMLSKVAEMHALRMACPEELSQLYVEEEYQQRTQIVIDKEELKKQLIIDYTEKLTSSLSVDDLMETWANIPGEIKKDLEEVKNQLKKKYEDTTI